jgi:hypothetical protein
VRKEIVNPLYFFSFSGGSIILTRRKSITLFFVVYNTGGALLGPNQAMARPGFLLSKYILLCV